MDDDRRARAEAIEGFAAALRELRDSVGNPSFREMSGRSGAISHTTLHEATKGNRLPSWETTVEFIKACGADPAAYRERWDEANLVVRSASADSPADGPPGGLAVTPERHTMHIAFGSQVPRSPGEASGPAPPRRPGVIAGDVSPLLAAQGSRERSRLTRPAAAALATAAASTGAAVLIVVIVNGGFGSEGKGQKPPGGPSTAALSPADCPVAPTNPPLAPPVHEGDAAAFVADITLPDCTRVGPGRTISKVWRLKNVGTVPWKGYSLRRIGVPQKADQCQTISDVPIKDTPPGKMVDIRTEITTPRKPGLCYVRFKMVDASGRVAFPGNRPVNFQIIIG